MENKLLNAIEKGAEQITYTENGALALNTSNSALVDCFAQCGASRGRPYGSVELFKAACKEDLLLATKLMFYVRDIRNGYGERRTARLMMRTLAYYYPEVLKKNLHLIPHFGRWDDLLSLLDFESVKDNVIELITAQLSDDIAGVAEGTSISLLAKWMPSINASSKISRQHAKFIIKELGISNADYRKNIARLRQYLNIVERKMSAKEFGTIDYESVPGLAMMKYRNSFMRQDRDRFKNYLSSIQKNEASIKAETLYPYNITEKYLSLFHQEADPVLEEQWKALPNYVTGDNRFLIMADVSGSMSGRPMATSIGLAIYFAERNTGPFANKFMTFSERPVLQELRGKTLFEKVNNLINVDWDMNTNLHLAFKTVLKAAINSNATQEEMPSVIIVISDMEIDQADRKNDTFYEIVKKEFADAGYKVPRLIFWNCDSRRNTFHAGAFQEGVQLVSGHSTAIFKSIVEAGKVNAYELMLKVLNDKRYDCVEI